MILYFYIFEKTYYFYFYVNINDKIKLIKPCKKLVSKKILKTFTYYILGVAGHQC